MEVVRMQKQKNTKIIVHAGKKLLSVYLVSLMLLASFAGMITSVRAEPLDVITTYYNDGGLIQATAFNDEQVVIVNISVNNTVGDPPGGAWYAVRALNQNTGEWILVNVTDNQSIGFPNTAGDGVYWGQFQVNSTHLTHNSTMPADLAVLQVQDADVLNISEIAGSPLDNDSEIEWCIGSTATYRGM